MPAVDDLHSCHLHGLGTGQGSGLGGTPRPEEKGRMLQKEDFEEDFDDDGVLQKEDFDDPGLSFLKRWERKKLFQLVFESTATDGEEASQASTDPNELQGFLSEFSDSEFSDTMSDR